MPARPATPASGGANRPAARLLADWAPPLAGVAGLAGILGYLFYAWRKAGRDPPSGTVVPLFSPPDNLSPAAMRYIVERGLDNRAFAASLVDAAVKGHVRLVEEDRGLFQKNERRIERIELPNPTPLDIPREPPRSMRWSARPRPWSWSRITMKIFALAKKELSDSFAETYGGKMFVRNYGWAGAAVVVFIAALMAGSGCGSLV